MITCIYCKEEELRAAQTKVCRACKPLVRYAAYKADTLLCRAEAHGEVPPPEDFTCVDCGRTAQSYDHRDYDRPLDVVPVCRSCNLKRGPAKMPEALRLHICARKLRRQ